MPEVAYNDIHDEDFAHRMPMLRSDFYIMRRDIDNLINNVSYLNSDAKDLRVEMS